MKKAALIGSILFLFGMVLFFVCYGLSGFQQGSTEKNNTEQTKALPTISGKLVVQDRYSSIQVGRSVDDQIHLRYVESDFLQYEVKSDAASDSLHIQPIRADLPWYRR